MLMWYYGGVGVAAAEVNPVKKEHVMQLYKDLEIKNADVITITPDITRKRLEASSGNGNRNINSGTVKRYAKDMMHD